MHEVGNNYLELDHHKDQQRWDFQHTEVPEICGDLDGREYGKKQSNFYIADITQPVVMVFLVCLFF